MARYDQINCQNNSLQSFERCTDNQVFGSDLKDCAVLHNSSFAKNYRLARQEFRVNP